MIPYAVFREMEREIEHVSAAEQLHQVRAVAHGAALAMSGDKPAVKRQTEKLIEQAYPEIPLSEPSRE